MVEWKKVAPQATHFPTLQPKQDWDKGEIEISLPGEVAIVDPKAAPGTYYQEFSFLKPGDYRIKLTYTNPQEWDHPLAKGTWSGTLASNELVLTVKPAK